MEMRFPDSPHVIPDDSSRRLRPLGWSELCARLIAAHDTRGVLARGAGAAPVGGRDHAGAEGTQAKEGGSFHDSAAALLRYVEMDAEGAVNPSLSVNGNDAAGKKGSGPNVAPQRRPDENRHD